MNYPQNIFVTVDAVTFHKEPDGKYQVLLIKRKYEPFSNHWALPGGFVDDDEDLLPACKRELKEETGIIAEDFYQLYTIGTPGRDPRGRTVSIVYTCFADKTKRIAKADDDAKEAAWFDINDLPPLAFDHEKVLKIAVESLKI